MQSQHTFQTKTGFCHILPDRILLTREGIAGETARVVTGNSMIRPFILYTIIAGFFFYSAYTSFIAGDNGFTAFSIAVGVWLIYAVISSLNNSATPIINRKSIQKVIFKKAILGLTRSRFEVFFQDNGKVMKRLIMLPGSLNGGQHESVKAVEIMKSEGLLS